MTKEQLIEQGFEPIKDHERYLIHRDGRIWGLRCNKLISLNTHTTGYIRVNLGRKKYLHHRILALQFIPNIENKPYINHINEIRDDNRLCNIEWCTPKENARHSCLGVRHPQSKPKKHYETKPTKKCAFKHICNTQGWDYNDFIEIYSGQKSCKHKKYYYLEKAKC